MAKGYVIITEAVHDPDGMKEYSKRSGSSLGAYGAKVLVVDEKYEVLEGEWPGKKTVVMEFPSVADAKGWYNSEGYQAALPYRVAAADCTAVIVEGFEMPGVASS